MLKRRTAALTLALALAAITVGALGATEARADAKPSPTSCRHSYTQGEGIPGPPLHPFGWPCLKFQNERAVFAYMRRVLVYNGYHNYVFKARNPRYLWFHGVRDGVGWNGDIVKLAPRKISVEMWPLLSGSFSQNFRTFRLAFVA